MLIIFTFLTFFSGSKKALFFVVGSIAMYEIIVTKGIKKFLKFSVVAKKREKRFLKDGIIFLLLILYIFVKILNL